MCISAQPVSDKRKCAACGVCGQRFSHGEARLQQWDVHAHCVNGGLGHHRELHPKQAGEQEAVDAVSRQRETIIGEAADTGVLMPFFQDPDQASTAAHPLDDEQDLFGGAEALRMDDEIMNFQWFDNVTRDSIKDLRGTTCVQPPPRFKFALQQAQHAILRAIIHNNPFLTGIRVSLESSGAQQLAPLGTTSCQRVRKQLCHLDARLDLFWAEDWSALWAVVRAEFDVAPVQSATSNSHRTETVMDWQGTLSCLLQQPAPDQDTWPKELGKPNLTDIHTSISSLDHTRDHRSTWTTRQKIHQ